MDNDNLTNQESLELITKMITAVKGNLEQAVFHLLLWGWMVIFMSLSHFIMLYFQLYDHPENIWLLSIPTFIVSFVYGLKKGRSAKVRTHLDVIFTWIWLAFAITFTVIFFLIMGYWEIFNAVILALAGYATFLSGVVLKFKPLIIGAILFWVWAIVAYFAGTLYAFPVMSLAIFTGYLVPGYLLKRKSNES